MSWRVFARRLILALLLAAADTVDANTRPILKEVAFSSIDGWAADDHAEALAAFRRSCSEMLQEGRAFGRQVKFGGSREQWLAVCRLAQKAGRARTFFEQQFTALEVHDPERPQGLFTGYYEPVAAGSRTRTPEYTVPVYRKPDDLVAFDIGQEAESGLKYGRLLARKPAPYHTRKDIEQGALAGQGLEIVWLKDWADAFFIHIQGSGRIRLPDGSLVRLAYAGKSGQPYTGIGGLLADRGVFSRDRMSMQATRKWMAANPQDARELMWENKSFIFFREVAVESLELGPPGAQKIALSPKRSLAVDRSIWIFGTPIWLDTVTPSGRDGSKEQFRRLMIAQDTGTAIRGYVRGDIFWGASDQAALTAGHLKSPGKMIVLLPKLLAAQFLGAQ